MSASHLNAHHRNSTDTSNRVAVTAQITIPPDGGWGWVVVLSSFTIFAIGDGTVFTFGSIYRDILTDLDLSPALVSLINSITVASSFIFGPVVSAVINRYGFRICAMVGSAITSSCCFLTFFFGNYVSLLLFYGFIAGLGFSMLNMPALLAVGFYFQRLRGIAFPVSIAGSSIGIIVLSLLYAHMANAVGWRYTLMLQASLTGFCYFVAMAYRPLLAMTVVVATGEDEEVPESEAVLSTIALKSGHGWGRGSIEEEGGHLRSFKSNQNFPTAAEVLSDMNLASTEPSSTHISPISQNRASLIAIIPINKHAEFHEHELERVRSLLNQIEEENEEDEKDKDINIDPQEVAVDQNIKEKKDIQDGNVDKVVERDKDTENDNEEAVVKQTAKGEKYKKEDYKKDKVDQNIEDDVNKYDEEANIDQIIQEGKKEIDSKASVDEKINEDKKQDDQKDNQKANIDKDLVEKYDDDRRKLRASRDYKVEFRMKEETTDEPQSLDGKKSRQGSELLLDRKKSRRASILLDGARSKSILFDRRRSKKESSMQLDGSRSKSVLLDRRRSRNESATLLDGGRSKSVLFDRKSSILKDILHWEEHVPEARPMYRDDAFLDNTKSVLTATHENVDENPIEYQLKVSRVAAAEDLKERKGMFTTAFTRVLFTMLDPSLLKRKSCLCVCFSMFLFYSAFLVPIIFVTDRGRIIGIPEEYRKWFLSAVGLAAIFGRFIGSLIALKAHPLHILFGMYTVAGVATILSIFGSTTGLQLLYCAIFGLTTAGTNSMRTVIFARLYGLENLTNCTGIAFLFQGVGCLISPPFAGALKGVWEQAPFIFSGICFIFSALLFLPVLSLVEKEKREEHEHRLR